MWFCCSVGKRSGHIPYRDSKLTRILQHSLGGNARTAIICTLSPALSHLEQSRNTLLFASRAKEVTNNAQVNMVQTYSFLLCLWISFVSFLVDWFISFWSVFLDCLGQANGETSPEGSGEAWSRAANAWSIERKRFENSAGMRKRSALARFVEKERFQDYHFL